VEFRFNHYGTYLREKFGGPVYKIMVDGGFTCPNRDGTKGTGGCIYCNNAAFTVGIIGCENPINQQVLDALREKKKRKRYRNARFLVYFQKYTNTYAPYEVLREKYESALLSEDIVGIVIGTRPDCVDEGVLDVLSSLAEKTHVSVELGLQTVSDDVLGLINRGHTVADFTRAAKLLRERGIEFGVHMIYGLPGDTRENFIEGARVISREGAALVKLNHIHVVSGTRLEEEWRKGRFSTPSLQEYLGAVCDFLEHLSPDVTVARLISTTPPQFLLAPKWNVGSGQFVEMVNSELAARGTRQGVRWKEERGVRGDGSSSRVFETTVE